VQKKYLFQIICLSLQRKLNTKFNLITSKMEYDRQCIICGNPTGYAYEVDVGVGIVRSSEAPICSECYMSEQIEIQKQIKEIETNKDLPF
jgi:hypothetical protein